MRGAFLAMALLRRRSLVLALATAAAAAGAFWAYVILSRKVRVLLAGEVLLADPNFPYTVHLDRREVVNHNVRLLRFALHSPTQARFLGRCICTDPTGVSEDQNARFLARLGIRPGQHVLLQASMSGQQTVRPYTPVSLLDQRGTFDLIVKVYAAGSQHPTGGLMSQFLDKLRPGEEVQVVGPRGHFLYDGRGHFTLASGRQLPLATQLGLVAAGSGVTPMLQLLRHMFADNRDQTSVVMIDVNVSEEDIIAREELDTYAKRFSSNFSIRHVLNKLPLSEGAEYLQGPLSRDILAAHLPPPDASTIVLCCGPQQLVAEICAPALRDIGHKEEQLLIY